MELLIGTAGWNYFDWKGRFYTENLPSQQRLEYYARHFNLVEINVSFYRFVKVSTYEKWREQTPESFSFTAKIHKYFTHLKRLKVDKEVVSTWNKFIQPLTNGLQSKIQALLLQLPPSLKADLSLLEQWIDKVYKTQITLFIEGRDSTWMSEEVISFLRSRNIGFVFSHSIKWDSNPRVKTTDDVYWRFHGPEKPFYSMYSEEEMLQYACLLRKLNPQRAFVIFNNTYRANAIINANMFKGLVNAC